MKVYGTSFTNVFFPIIPPSFFQRFQGVSACSIFSLFPIKIYASFFASKRRKAVLQFMFLSSPLKLEIGEQEQFPTGNLKLSNKWTDPVAVSGKTTGIPASAALHGRQHESGLSDFLHVDGRMQY